MRINRNNLHVIAVRISALVISLTVFACEETSFEPPVDYGLPTNCSDPLAETPPVDEFSINQVAQCKELMDKYICSCSCAGGKYNSDNDYQRHQCYEFVKPVCMYLRRTSALQTEDGQLSVEYMTTQCAAILNSPHHGCTTEGPMALCNENQNFSQWLEDGGMNP